MWLDIRTTCKLARREGTDVPEERAAFARLQGKLDSKRSTWREIRMRQSDYGNPVAREAEAAPHLRHPGAPGSGATLPGSRIKGIDGENLSSCSSRGVRQVVYRMGLGSTRAEARRLVTHGSVVVNGKRLNVPSALLKAGDVVTVAEKSKTQLRIIDALQARGKGRLPGMGRGRPKKLQGRSRRAGPRTRVRPGTSTQ
jgi:small subunit ribosomal protein S4